MRDLFFLEWHEQTEAFICFQSLLLVQYNPTPLDSYDVLLLDVFVVSVLGIPKIGIYRSDALMS